MPTHRLVRSGLGLFALSSLLISAPLGSMRAHTVRAAGFQGTITMYAQAYNPTPSMKISPTNQTPRNAFTRVAAAWEKMHPGVHIKFVTGPASNYDTWARTLITGESAPDIIWWQSDPRFIDTGKVVQLDSWLNKPNPYNPSGGKWMDTFLPPYRQVAQTANHHYGWVPMDVVSTGIFYNKTLLQKAGLNPNNYNPPTWAAWMKDMATIKAKLSIQPFCSFFAPQNNWPERALGNELMWQDVQKYGTLTYQPNHTPGVVGEEEMTRAVTKLGWLPSKDAGLAAMFQVLKGMADNSCQGWATLAGNRDVTNFLLGKTAFLWEGTWTAAQLKNDPRRNFEFGTFWLPTVTKETTPVVHNPPYPAEGVGGYGSINYAVTKSAVNDGSEALAINFLQYATTPANDSLIVNEQPQFVVAVKGAPDKSGLRKFFVGESHDVGGTQSIDPFDFLNDTGGAAGFAGAAASQWSQKFLQVAVSYWQGQIDLHSALSQLDAVAKTQAALNVQNNDKTKNKLGTWDLTKW